MNKTAIKNFAVWARNKLREEIRTRAGFVGIAESGIANPLPASTSEIKYFNVGAAQPIAVTGKELQEREKLVRLLEQQTKQSGGDYKTVYDQMIENYAYDWFNRLIAIRFMEVNEYFPDNLRVLSSIEEGAKDPDIVSMPFSSDLEFSERERAQIVDWKTKEKSDSLFRFLLKKRCNQLHECLPGLFEQEGDASELMMHFSFVDQDGIIYHLVHDIEEKDWKEQVQIIGWIYQYYNSELKDETFALAKKGKKITKERIPSATQLFTPDWIVRYMVENSLGRIWLEGHPNEELKSSWKYYLEEAEQEPEVKAQLEEIRKEYRKLTPEELTFIDPCMGSGHILVYAFDVLMQIYESQGYTSRDAVQSILKNNLYGLDIDDRAYQLAYFSVMMKAREYDPRILERGIVPQVYAIQESNGITSASMHDMGLDISEAEYDEAVKQAKQLVAEFKNAKEYGSIIDVTPFDGELLRRFALPCTASEDQLSLDIRGEQEASKRLQNIINIGETLARKYDVVVTNPPYMGAGNMNLELNNYIRTNYEEYKSDFFSAFIIRCMKFSKEFGRLGFLTPYVWMFILSYEKLRKKILKSATLTSLIQFEYSSFEEAIVPICTFTLLKYHAPCRGAFIRLTDFRGGMEVQKLKTLEAINNHKCGYYYENESDRFSDVPGQPIAYWKKNIFFDNFVGFKSLNEYSDVKKGLTTADNNRFLRYWWEVVFNSTNVISNDNSKKWVRTHKGGEYRKWYGNLENVINWSNDGTELKAFSGSVIRNENYYFKECISWNDISSAKVAFRYIPEGSISNASGPSFYSSRKTMLYLIGLSNSVVVSDMLTVLCPTIHFEIGQIAKIPVRIDRERGSIIEENVNNCIRGSKGDWDSFEISWDFTTHPLILFRDPDRFYDLDDNGNFLEAVNYSLEDSFLLWQDAAMRRFNQLKANEEELNRIFIDIYGLQDELTPEVDDKDVTVRKADLGRDIRSLISYAVGCMFGRYSLDTPGLAYAGGEWDAAKYNSFIPDTDNVIPITDTRYLDNDIVEQFIKWLTIVYGKDTLEENLDFIAKALGTKGTDSRDIIRNYFLKDFFKDHCATYSVTGSGKRPIYWLFDSGKQNGFKVLIYMHRYNADTIGRVRVSYLHRIQEKYENEVRAIDTITMHMTDQRQLAIEEKRKEKLLKQIAEVKEYDEKLDHLAAEKIEIDLDDGVKVNYEKVQTDRDGMKYQILAPIK